MPISCKIIKTGDLLLQPEENPLTTDLASRRRQGLTGASTVTCLSDGQQTLVVDTGFALEGNMHSRWRRHNHEKLRQLLRDNTIEPDQVGAVFITHWHRDHFGNAGLFNQVHLLSLRPFPQDDRLHAYLNIVEGIDVTRLETVRDGDVLLPGVRVVATPGHTADHSSLLVETDSGRVAVASDCILNETLFRGGQVWQHNRDFFSLAAARESLRRLEAAADAIIPGHGDVFKP